MADEPACRFRIPRPPSTNALYANVPGKGRVKTKRYRDWITAAGWEMRAQGTVNFSCGSVRMLIEGVGKMDVDNVKAIPDLCKAMGIIADDKLIEDLRIVRAGDVCTVSIWSVGRFDGTLYSRLCEQWEREGRTDDALWQAAPRYKARRAV